MQKIYLKTLIAFLLVMLGCIGCFDKSSNTQQNQLIVGTNAEYAPYAYIENGEIIGVEIEVIQAVAKKLNKQIILKDMPFDALIPQLKLKKIDIIAAGLTPTAERKKSVLFTEPHLYGDPLVIVSLHEHPIHTLEQMQGNIIAVNEGYTADLFLVNQNLNINLLYLPTAADGFLSLQAQRCQGFVTAKSTFNEFTKQTNKKHNFNVAEIPDSQESYAFAVSKDNIELQQQVQQAIVQLSQEGALNAIKQHWSFE